MKNIETYVVAGENVIECRRCGARKPFTLPLLVSTFVDFVEVFNREHAQCAEHRVQADATPQPSINPSDQSA